MAYKRFRFGLVIVLLGLVTQAAGVELRVTSASGEPDARVSVTLDLIDAVGTAIASFALEYDADRLSLEDTVKENLGDLFDLVDLTATSPGQFSGSFLSADGMAETGGSLVSLTFLIAGGAADGVVDLHLKDIEFKDRDGQPLEATSADGQIEIGSSQLLGDFDGNRLVDFSDFFLFVDRFGSNDPVFDLDGGGTVDFGDFFLFVDNFGKQL